MNKYISWNKLNDNNKRFIRTNKMPSNRVLLKSTHNDHLFMTINSKEKKTLSWK